jgi:tripartite-type tricarboxylate transporter receptor subunit TctC
MKKLFKTASMWICGLTVFVNCSYVTASTYPSEPLTMIVPYAAGGSADAFARPIADQLSKILKQTVVVDLRPGAGGNIGAQYVAKNAKPDGYTFLFASVSLATSPSLAKISFNPATDLTAVAGVATVPSLLLVSNNSPYKSLKELVAAIKDKKLRASFGSSGNNTGSHLVGELFKSSAGIDMVHVPYKGSGAVYPDLIAERITVLFDVMGSSVPQVKSGQVRALAITSKNRSKLLPDVPTIAELGYPGFEFGTWFGFFVPSKTPPDVRKKLEVAILEALKLPAIQERLNFAGAEPLPGPGPEFEKWFLADIALWEKMVKEGKLQRSD